MEKVRLSGKVLECLRRGRVLAVEGGRRLGACNFPEEGEGVEWSGRVRNTRHSSLLYLKS